jgi:hypothetical protein
MQVQLARTAAHLEWLPVAGLADFAQAAQWPAVVLNPWEGQASASCPASASEQEAAWLEQAAARTRQGSTPATRQSRKQRHGIWPSRQRKTLCAEIQ